MQKVNLYVFAVLLLLLGAFNWGFIALFEINLLQHIIPHTGIRRLIYLCIGVAGIILAMDRNFYFPFLGKTVIPCSLFHEVYPKGADDEIVVKVRPNSAVVYWSSLVNEPDDPVKYATKEDGSLCNAGIAVADDNGNARLRLRTIVPYMMDSIFDITPYVHYRVCESSGVLGSVKTVVM